MRREDPIREKVGFFTCILGKNEEKKGKGLRNLKQL